MKIAAIGPEIQYGGSERLGDSRNESKTLCLCSRHSAYIRTLAQPEKPSAVNARLAVRSLRRFRQLAISAIARLPSSPDPFDTSGMLTVLNLAIGITFIYLLLSLVVSALN